MSLLIWKHNYEYICERWNQLHWAVNPSCLMKRKIYDLCSLKMAHKQKHPYNCNKIELLLKLGLQTDVLLLACARMFFNLLFLVVLELKVSLFIAHL